MYLKNITYMYNVHTTTNVENVVSLQCLHVHVARAVQV